MRAAVAALLLLLAFAAPGFAALDPAEMLDDPVEEARARAISKELRCLVCQNQSIDDSDAALARDLRAVVRDRIRAGDTDAEVFEFIVARYGQFVLMTPPFTPATWLLWLAPGLVLVIGGGIALLVLRRARGRGNLGLSADEEARLAALVKPEASNKSE
ncbi:MAG: cytochrome c-type biogenesis protein [Parvibaculum sp.]|uniref:cytochrome c-type biogenesis protein n=1 Tax=Parvibaculum sp. TaxID=2024848 RepID=UPI0034A05B9D